jgi:hypothetical protein
MIGESLLAGAMALTLNPAGYFPDTTPIENRYVEKISCDGGSGTGFRLADGRWASVDHVTKNTGCKVDGLPILVTHADPVGDFSTFIVPGDTRRGGLKVDCSGFRYGWYWATGHARGGENQAIPLLYSMLLNTTPHDRGWSVLGFNRVIPGMSGGPLFRPDGRVVGTVNAFAIYFEMSFSKPLSGTILCQPSS